MYWRYFSAWQPRGFRFANPIAELIIPVTLISVINSIDFPIRNGSASVTIFEDILRSLDPKDCQFELDAVASYVSGVDAGAHMAAHPGRFCAAHLRDLKIPDEDDTNTYPETA